MKTRAAMSAGELRLRRLTLHLRGQDEDMEDLDLSEDTLSRDGTLRRLEQRLRVLINLRLSRYCSTN